MARTFSLGVTALIGLLAFLAVPGTAHAYLDPGSGSMMTQMAVASLAGALFALKMFWRNILRRFRSRKSTAEAAKPVGRDRDEG